MILSLLLAAVLDEQTWRQRAQAQGRLREQLGLGSGMKIHVVNEGGCFFHVDVLSSSGTEAGHLDVTVYRSVPDAESACGNALSDARTQHGALGIAVVGRSKIRLAWRGRGVGEAMYEAALVEAHRRGALLVSDNLHMGTTTSSAADVWERLLARYEGGRCVDPVTGETGYWVAAVRR